jgi:hypothetical protein
VKSLNACARSLALIVALLCCGTPLAAQTDASRWSRDSELKAAFVFNIVPFVEWPPETLGDRFVIGVAGESPMASVMAKSFAGKRIGSRIVEVREVHSRSELRACNILLLAFPDRSRMGEAFTELRGTNVLTIGDSELFTKLGGVVTFVQHDSTYRLAINPRAAERAHLKISSKLLSIATMVSDDEADRKE